MGNVSSSIKKQKWIVTDNSHQAQILALLNVMRDNGELTDFTIHSGDALFKCHRAVLMAASFNSHSKTTNEIWTKGSSTTLNNVKAAVVGSVVDYIYTSYINIEQDNIKDLTTIAKKLQLWALEHACEQFYVESKRKPRQRKMSNPAEKRNFCDVNHAKALLLHLHEMRSNPKLTDTVIDVGGKHFPCHRAILASCSIYFKAMFTSDMKERNLDLVVLNDVKPSIFEVLLDFVYTSQILLKSANFEETLVTANYLQIQSHALTEQCSKMLLDKLSLSNCLKLLNSSQGFLCPDFDREAVSLVNKHFKSLCKCKEFLELSGHHLIQIVSDDSLNVDEEDTVLDTVVRWIKFDKCRQERSAELMKHVRFPFISRTHLDAAISTEPTILQSSVVSEYIEESKKHLVTSLSQEGNQRFKPRVTFTTPCVLMLGSENSQTDCIGLQCYMPTTGRWSNLAPVPSKLTSFKVVTVNNDIYVMGMVMFGDISTLWQYSTQYNTWTEKAPMNTKRWNYALCALSGLIYSIGGLSPGDYCMEEVAVYNPESNTWQEGVPLLEGMGGPMALAYSECSKLLVFNCDESIDSMQVYVPAQKKWSLISAYHPPPNIGAFEAAFLLNAAIYILGYTRNTPNLQFWVFDLSTNCWRRSIPVTHFETCGNDIVCICSIANKMYIVFKAYGRTKNGMEVKRLSFDSYDCLTDHWVSMKSWSPNSNWPAYKMVTVNIYKHAAKEYSESFT